MGLPRHVSGLRFLGKVESMSASSSRRSRGAVTLDGSLRTCRGDSVRNGSGAHGRLRYDISPVCCNELEAVLICRATPTRR